MSTTQAVPHRYTFKSFQFYESSIALILERFPRVVVLDPKQFNRSYDTFAARLRDAMKAACEHGYHTDKFSLTRLIQLYKTQKQIVVSQHKGLIYVGSKDGIRELLRQPLVEAEDARMEPFRIPAITSIEVLACLCYLASARQFKNPLKFTLADDMWAAEMNQKYDIDLVFSEPYWILT